MMTLVKWLKARQTDEGLNDAGFSRKLGISQAAWCRLQSGERSAGLHVLRATLTAYPEKRAEILSHVQGFPTGNEIVTDVQEVA